MRRVALPYSVEEEKKLQIPESVLSIRDMLFECESAKGLLRGPVWIPLEYFDAFIWEYELTNGNSNIMVVIDNPIDHPVDAPDIEYINNEINEIVTETGEKWQR